MVFHCLQESCFVKAHQYADYLATEPPYHCLNMKLRLAILGLFPCVTTEHRGQDTGVALCLPFISECRTTSLADQLDLNQNVEKAGAARRLFHFFP